MTLASNLKQKMIPGVAVPHLIIEALAGTGKTTTLVQGLNRLMGQSVAIHPSPQQRAIWECLELSKGSAKSACFVAFNKSIAQELQVKVPVGCEAMTLHSLGMRALMFEYGPLTLQENRNLALLSKVLQVIPDTLIRTDAELVCTVDRITSLCKKNLSNIDSDGAEIPVNSSRWAAIIDDLADYYEVELNGDRQRVIEAVPKVIEESKRVGLYIDYDDMVWLPVTLRLPVRAYDLLLVDEAQDLSRCQQALAFRAGRRLVFCGDSRQAIYGFAGADARSMAYLKETLEASANGCQVLPLTITRRCGRAIVAEAQKIVPEFEAHKDNCQGFIRHMVFKPDPRSNKMIIGDWIDAWEDGDMSRVAEFENSVPYTKIVQDNDMVLCRCNAPLISECFKFLKMGRKATIQGRDIGKNLVKAVRKIKATNIPELILKFGQMTNTAIAKERAKRNPREYHIIALQDRADCVACLAEGTDSIEELVNRVDRLFTDNTEQCGIRLSTIHKAKGLEAKRVFLLEPPGATVPHPMAKSAWQLEQEINLRYVAITRAIEELVYVS